ncbi:MAG: SRPBCC family protein [Rubripirellula sp.]
MPAYHVQRSIIIQASPEKVYDTVADFGTWTKWSPWLGVDKEAVVSVSEDPRSIHSHYHWKGELVGEGVLEHVTLDRPHLIEDEIRFVKPFKSQSDVSFELEPEGDGTKITWHMKGKLPFYLFWMKSKMDVFIGMDYQRGLKMLRELIETSRVLSDVNIMGVEDVESKSLIGHSNTSSIDGISAAMETSIRSVTEKLTGSGACIDGEMISAYHPTDLKLGRFDFITGYALDHATPVPAGLDRCDLPAGRALHVRHTGSYDNLGNAWSGAYQFARYKKLKIAKQDGYEIYRNDPNETDSADLITDIYLPLR